MDTTLTNLAMILSILLMIVFLVYAYGFRNERGIIYFVGVLMCRIVFAGSVVLEQNVADLAEKIIFRNVQQTALLFTVPFMVLFLIELLEWGKLSGRREQMFLFVPFALWSILVWLNPYLHVVYHSTELVHQQLVVNKSIYATMFSLACYVILTVCIFKLFQYARRVRSYFREPVIWLLALGSLQFLLEIAKSIRPDLWINISILSVYSGFIGMIMLVIIIRRELFSIIPVARNVVVDTLQQGILIANTSGKVVDYNDSAGRWFAKQGHSSIIGRSIGALLSQWPEWHSCCASMRQGEVEITMWLDGEKKWFQVHIYPLYNKRKYGKGSVSVLIDMTEKQRHLEQIARLNELKDQLFTIVSHDIRSPLTTQMQLIHLLEEDKDMLITDHRKAVSMLSDQLRNTFDMVDNLLEWFRSQREGVSFHPQPLKLSKAVTACIHVFRAKCESKQISVNVNIDPDATVIADREILGLLLRNLLSNAIKFTGIGGVVDVYAGTKGERTIISVRDNGVGMSEDQLRHLFDETRLTSLRGTSGEKGAGLGLLVCSQFVRLNGGELWAESTPGQGSVFHFTVETGSADVA